MYNKNCFYMEIFLKPFSGGCEQVILNLIIELNKINHCLAIFINNLY